MRTEMLIRMEKGHAAKALKVAAAMQGVESVTLSGKDKSLLRVVGDGVDCNHLTTRLRRKVGHADVVELRTLHGGAGNYSGYGGSVSRTGSGLLSRDAAAPAAAYGNGGSSYYGYNYPTTTSTAMAPPPDYYYGGHHQQHQPSFQYSYPPPQYAAVHYESYPSSAADPNSCSIM